MQDGSYWYRIDKELNGHDGLRLLGYLRGDHYSWAQQHSLIAETAELQVCAEKHHGKRPVQEVYWKEAGDKERPIFEQALSEPMDRLNLSISPAFYFPLGQPGIFNRIFVAFPTGIPIIRTRIERFGPGQAYRMHLSVERDKRQLDKGIEDALGCDLLPITDLEL